MKKTVLIIGTLDTKGGEAFYLKDRVESYGYDGIILDVSLRNHESELGEPNISNVEVAEAANSSLEEIAKMERTPAMNSIVRGGKIIVGDLYDNDTISGVIGFGGGCGTSISCSILRDLPLTFPKVVVTTVPHKGGNFIGTKDITIASSITDMIGEKNPNSIESKALANAAGAISGMIEVEPKIPVEKPSICASQFGVTTPHINQSQQILGGGYDFISFHATGIGGRTLEDLAESEMIDGVLDVTTTELADELVGGVLSAGPGRLEAAGGKGIPQVILPGALDMVNFWAPDTVPSKFKNRKFYQHTPEATLMRTSVEENRRLGKIIAEKVNKSKGPTLIIIPMLGFSQYDREGEVKVVDFDGLETGEYWHDFKADEEFANAIYRDIDSSKSNIEVLKREFHINDKECSELAAESLDRMIRNGGDKIDV